MEEADIIYLIKINMKTIFTHHFKIRIKLLSIISLYISPAVEYQIILYVPCFMCLLLIQFCFIYFSIVTVQPYSVSLLKDY